MPESDTNDETPIFEIYAPENIYRIFASGKIEGFPEGAFIINRIPLMNAKTMEQGSKEAGQ